MDLLKLLMICIVLDFISGILKSIINKNTKSKKVYDGIVKKLSLLVMVSLSYVIDSVLQSNGTTIVMVETFIIACESISCVENLGACGVPIPKKFLDILEVLKNDESE